MAYSSRLRLQRRGA